MPVYPVPTGARFLLMGTPLMRGKLLGRNFFSSLTNEKHVRIKPYSSLYSVFALSACNVSEAAMADLST